MLLGIRVLVLPYATVAHTLGGARGVAGVGTLALSFRIPDQRALLGTDFHFQAAYLDPAGLRGWTATDGLQLNVR
ncbi:MAG: hypothetical protein AAF628_36450 [Planctomycetota bacterium]